MSRAHLDQPVPASGDDDGVGGDWGEAHARHPLRVTIRLSNGVLALADGVPQLDGLVAGARHDLQFSHDWSLPCSHSLGPEHVGCQYWYTLCFSRCVCEIAIESQCDRTPSLGAVEGLIGGEQYLSVVH